MDRAAHRRAVRMDAVSRQLRNNAAMQPSAHRHDARTPDSRCAGNKTWRIAHPIPPSKGRLGSVTWNSITYGSHRLAASNPVERPAQAISDAGIREEPKSSRTGL